MLPRPGRIARGARMNYVTVGVGDCQTEKDPRWGLVTYALGSCIAVTLHDPVALVGGLLHFMLPESAIDQDSARRNPFKFADSGIPLLLERVCAAGAHKRRLVVTACGGAQIADVEGVFNIGKRNCLALRKMLWKSGLMLAAEDLGGMASRTVRLEISTGRVSIREAAAPEVELFPGQRAGRSFQCRTTC